MNKCKITKKGDTYYVYTRFLLFFWRLYDSYLCEYNAKKEVEFLNTKEERIY